MSNLNYSIYANSVPVTNGTVSITNGSSYSLNATAAPTIWATSSSANSSSAVVIKGDAEFHGRVRINGADFADTLESIQKRLAILVPDPERLAKYEALQQAYDHYKTLEALCFDEHSTTK